MEESRPIVKLTGLPVSDEMMDIINMLVKGEYVDIDRIENTVEMKTAYSHINHSIPTIDISGREAEQIKHIADMLKFGSAAVDNEGKTVYTGIVDKSSRLDLVIGLPASGKSSAIVDTISSEFHSRIIDNDEAKKMIPEFNDGWGADVVHKESQLIADEVFDRAINRGENIVLPKVGSDAQKLLKNYIKPAVKKGYLVNLHFVDLDRNKTLGRMLSRFFSEGRFLSPRLIDGYCNNLDGNKVERCYEELKHSEFISGYSRWDNDVEKGERPVLVEYNNLEGDYILTAEKETELDSRNIEKEEKRYGRANEDREWNSSTADIRDNRGGGRWEKQNVGGDRERRAGRESAGQNIGSGRKGRTGEEPAAPRGMASDNKEVLSDTASREVGDAKPSYILNNEANKPFFPLDKLKSDKEEKIVRDKANALEKADTILAHETQKDFPNGSPGDFPNGSPGSNGNDCL